MEETLFTEATIGHFFTQQVQNYPDKDFIIYPDRDLCMSYKQFNERVDNLAKGLLEIGIDKGDHVGIWARNVPDWLTFFFATSKIGAVLVTINIHYKTHELEYVIRQSDMKALVTIDRFRDNDYLETIYHLIPELKTMQRGHLKTNKFPFLQSVIYLGPEKYRGMYNTNELLTLGKQQEDEKLESKLAQTANHEVINMQYTSGTTGFPKGVMLSHRNILNNGYYIGACQDFSDKDIVCLPVPLFHCFGIVLGVLATLTHGGTLVMLEEFNARKTLKAVEKAKCTALYGVPTMFIAELSLPDFKDYDLRSLRTGIMAGSPCPMETMKQVINDMHCKDITIAYGLTESSPVFTQTRTDDPLEKRVETVGRALPHIEVKIIDPDTGKDLPPGKAGEICCRGYNTMKGYYKMPEATAKTIDQDGWLHSGDLAIQDEDGYFSITGRIKDMIIRGGENIYPREIEEFLYAMPEIWDVQVVGVPDEKYGEVVGAFIIPKEGFELTEDIVRNYCLEKIARYKIPKYFFFIDSFPMTASGKVQKYKLREQANEIVNSK